jgi:purine/pyrimidine-nucleoside phosphorylase
MQHNVYFGGAVQSLGFVHAGGAATVGVMDPGQYEFSTGLPEKVDIIAGGIEAKMPGEDWRFFNAGESFNVPAHSKFQVRLESAVAYVCWFG